MRIDYMAALPTNTSGLLYAAFQAEYGANVGNLRDAGRLTGTGPPATKADIQHSIKTWIGDENSKWY